MSAICGACAGTTLDALAGDLARLADLGYTAAELNPEYLDVMFGGRLQPAQVARAAAACRPYAAPAGLLPPGRLRISVHAPAVLDLRSPLYPEVHRAILCSTVEFAAEIGARVVVVHYEQRSDSESVEAQFKRGIEAAAKVAGRVGVLLAVENIEVERAERVVEFVDRLGIPHVGLTYDFGHDFLAAAQFGYDHLASVAACAPLAIHAHLSDNFGRFDPARLGDFTLYKAIPPRNLNVAGLGDVHLPLGWGALPYEAAIDAFRTGRRAPFDGILLGEHRRAFATQDAAVLSRLQGLAARLAGDV